MQDLNDALGEIVILFQEIPGFSENLIDDMEAQLNTSGDDPGYRIVIKEKCCICPG